MEQDPGLKKMAFSFVRVAPRPGKPREAGLTVVADRGIAMHRVADLIEAGAEFIDFVKIGIGAYRLQTEDLLKRKIVALRAAQIRVFLAGDVTEAAFQQGVSSQFYAAVKEYGAEAVEVSSAQVAMSLRDKCELIRMASAAGLKVVAEAGQKGIEDWTSSQSYVFAQVDAYKKAGAWKVLVQGEGVRGEGAGVRGQGEGVRGEGAGDRGQGSGVREAGATPTKNWAISSIGF